MQGMQGAGTQAEAFVSIDELERWLRKNHATASELWVRVFKKGSGTPSVDWNDCVRAALCWGWIDGQRRSFDERSFLQRLTPRRAGSNWSQRNRELVEQLIAEERMQPPGLRAVEAARESGQWDRAYAGSASMEMPGDLLEAVQASPVARDRFATLDRGTLFEIYRTLQTAKRPETRARRIAAFVGELERTPGDTGPRPSPRRARDPGTPTARRRS